MIVLTTAVLAFVTLPSQSRCPAHPHGSDQLDYAEIGTEGVNVNFTPVPEQLSDAVEGS
jgi:hypothetical protein